MARSKAPKRVKAVPPAPKRRVLIADDHEDSGITLRMLMSTLGYEVRLVPDGDAAVREALAFRPDVVILDIGMPKISGYDAAHLIRQSLPGRKMLIVALSGWARPQDIDLSAAAGMDAHLAKPLDLKALIRIIDAFF